MDGGPKRFLDGTFKPFSLCGNTEGQSAMDSGGLQNFMNDILHDNVFKDGSASQTNEPVEEEDDVSVHRETADDDASSKDSSLQSLSLSEGDGRDQSDDLGNNACRPSLDLQERLSSIRTPHFAQSQHFRECNDTIAVKRSVSKSLTTLAAGTRSILQEGFRVLLARYRVCIYQSEPGILQKQSPRLDWYCAQISTINSSSYRFGLLRKSFVGDLCWHNQDVKGYSMRNTIAENGLAFPTWSWMSVDGAEVVMVEDDLKVAIKCIRVISVNVRYGTDESLGNIKQGLLTMDVSFLHEVKF